MSDEAVVRIVLQDDAASAVAGGGGSAPGAGAGGGNAGVGGGGGIGSTTLGAKNFTYNTGRFVGRYEDIDENDVAFFEEQADKRRHREIIMQKIDEKYHEKYPKPEVQVDFVVEAQRLLDARLRREEIYKKIDELDPRLSEREQRALQKAIDQEERLREKQRRDEIAEEERQQDLMRKEYQAYLNVERKKEAERLANLPVLEETDWQKAKNRFDREQQKAAEDYHYNKDFKIEEVEQEEQSPFGQFLGFAKQFRGLIGGKLGSAAGGMLDVMSLMDKNRKAKVKEGIPEAMPADAPPGEATTGVAGMAGEFMGAAGPLGAALIAKEIGEKINKTIVDGIKSSIGAASKVANFAASADADPATAIQTLGDAASNAGQKLDDNFVPIIGKVAIAGGEAAKALAAFMQAVDQTVDRYAEYSPQIAQAQAIAEIRQTMGDFRRAQEGTPELARFVRTQADLQQRFEDIKIRLLTRILTVVNPILEQLERSMSGAENIAGAINKFGSPLLTIADAASRLARLQEKDEDPIDPTEIILGKDDVGNFRFPSGQVPPINQLPGG